MPLPFRVYLILSVRRSLLPTFSPVIYLLEPRQVSSMSRYRSIPSQMRRSMEPALRHLNTKGIMMNCESLEYMERSRTHPNKESQYFYVLRIKPTPRCCRRFSPLSTTKENWLWIPSSIHSVSSGPFYSVYPYQESLQSLPRPNQRITSPRLLAQLWDLEVPSGSQNHCMQGSVHLHLLLPGLSQPISLTHVPIDPKLSNFGRRGFL